MLCRKSLCKICKVIYLIIVIKFGICYSATMVKQYTDSISY